MDSIPNVTLDCPLCQAPLPAAVVDGAQVEILLCPGCGHPLTCGNGRAMVTPPTHAANTALPWLTPPIIPPVATSALPSLSMSELFDEPAEPAPLDLVEVVEDPPSSRAAPVSASPPPVPAPRRRRLARLPTPQSHRHAALGWAAVGILALAGADWAIARPTQAAPGSGTSEVRPLVIVGDILVVQGGSTTAELAAGAEVEPRTAVLVPSKAPGRSPPLR